MIFWTRCFPPGFACWGWRACTGGLPRRQRRLLNAPGTGAADDKAVYGYVPAMIKYYLGEEPILNNVHTYRCEPESDYKFVLENMEKLVIKPVDEVGATAF